MALRVNNNPPAVNAHATVYKSERALNKSMEKVSSGLKIVRAADGPASLIISEQMRSQIKGIEQAIRNSETGVAMMQTTEAALNEVSRMLTDLRMLAVHAANEAVNDEYMLEADQQEVNNILNTLDRIARNTSFGNKKVLDGTAGANGVTTGEGLEFVRAGETTVGTEEFGYDVLLTQAATRNATIGTETLTNDLVQAGERITIIDEGKEATVKGTALDTAETIVSKLQTSADRSGMNVDIELLGGKIAVQHKEYGSKTNLYVYSDTDGVLSQTGGELERISNGQDIQGTINGELATGEGRVLTSVEGNRTTEGISVRYIGDIGQPGGPEIDDEKGSKVGTVNISQRSLRFQLGDSFDQNQSVSILSVFSSELGQGVVNDSGFRSLKDIDLRSFEGANDALRLINSAQNKVSASRGDIGAFQKNLLEANVNSMMSLRENMIYSESTIRDADIAEEMATFTKRQILQQASMSMMKTAANEPRNILSLIQQ